MIFDNVNSINPIDETVPHPFNPLDSLTSRVNGLEKKMVDNETEFTTETLNATTANIDVANIGELNFEGEVKLQNVEDLEIQNDLTVGNDVSCVNLNAEESITSNSVTTTDLTVGNDISCVNINVEESITSNSVTTTDLTSTNIETEDVTINSLEDTAPTDTTLALGYDENGKVIPIKTYQLYDYIVDSQNRFNALMEMSKSTNGVTYKNIAIIGGYGSGTNSEYEYKVDSETTDGNFNGANIDCYKSATINVTVDEFTVSVATSVKIFNDVNIVNDLTVLVNGAKNENLSLYLFSGSTVSTTLNNILIKEPTNSVGFVINNAYINNGNNFDYVKFDYCNLKNTTTVASYVYRSVSDSFIPILKESDLDNIYNEDYVGFTIETSTISYNKTLNSLSGYVIYLIITSVEMSKIYVDDDGNIDILCKSSDETTSFIGNNKISLVDTSIGQAIIPLNTYLPYYSKIKHETSTYTYSFVDLGEASQSVLFTNTNPSSLTTSNSVYLVKNGKNFGSVKKWKIMNGTNFITNVYTLGSSTTTYYTDLTFTTYFTLSSSQTATETVFTPLEIPYLSYTNQVPYYASSTVEFPSSTSCFIDLGESSKTLYYSNDNGVTAYLDVKCTKQIKKWKNSIRGNLVYTLGTDESVYYTDLSFTTLYTTTNTMETASFNPLKLYINESYSSSMNNIQLYQNTNQCKIEGLGVYEIAYTSNP